MPAEQTPEMATNVSVIIDNIVAGDAAVAVSLAALRELLAAVDDALPLLKQGPKERAKRDRLESAAAKFQL